MTADERIFLKWVIARLVHVYHENPNVDYMQKLRQLASDPIDPKVHVIDGADWPAPDTGFSKLGDL